MRRLLTLAVLLGAIGLAPAAHAFSCPNDFAAADKAIADAEAAMNSMSGDKGLVHTLIDDAKMLLHSARHNHKKPAAGGYDHARAVAKARAATGYAEAASVLASK